MPTCLRDCFPEGVPAASIPRYFVLLHATMFNTISQSKNEGYSLCFDIISLHPCKVQSVQRGKVVLCGDDHMLTGAPEWKVCSKAPVSLSCL